MLWLLYLWTDSFLFYFIICKEKYYLCLCFEEWRLPSFTHFIAINCCFFSFYSLQTKNLSLFVLWRLTWATFFYIYFLLCVVTTILHTTKLPVIVSLHKEIWPFFVAITHCRDPYYTFLRPIFLSLSQCHYIVHTLERFNHFLLPLQIVKNHTPPSSDSSFQWVPPLSPLICSYYWKYIIQRTMLLAWEFYYFL